MTITMMIISTVVSLLSASATGVRLPVTTESTATGCRNYLTIVTVNVITRKSQTRQASLTVT